MAYLASLTATLSPWQWGALALAAAILTYLAAMAGIALYSWAYARRAAARFSDMQAENATVNPLDSHFERKRISLRDFYHSFFKWNKNQSFTDCDLIGPFNIGLSGSPHFSECTFVECEWVVIWPGAPIFSVVAFESPKFLRCIFHRVTVFVTAADAQHMVNAMPLGHMNVISDGSCGTIGINPITGTPNAAKPT